MNMGIAVDCDKTKEWLRLARKFVLLGRLWGKGRRRGMGGSIVEVEQVDPFIGKASQNRPQRGECS
jgi:hypothetical protein